MPKLILIAHVPTDSVNEGFLPAARKLGLEVILLTDQAEAHRAYFSASGLPGYPQEIIECDVFSPTAVIAEICRQPDRPVAIFSNSDHLQVSTSLAADYFGLPGKDWKAAYRTKNKAAMRATLSELGIDLLWHAVVTSDEEIAALQAPLYPCILKPREGVGSQLVRLCHTQEALRHSAGEVWQIDPGRPMIVEEYIPGDLYTFETLGDGSNLVGLGGFHVKLSDPPHFVEMEARWGRWLTESQEAEILTQIQSLGVGFGSCHTELVLTPSGPKLIEVNYRTVGDQREFMLQSILGIDIFEQIIKIHLGKKLGSLQLESNIAAIRYFPIDKSGEIEFSPDPYATQDAGVYVEYRALRKRGEHMKITHSNKDYLGVLSVIAPNQHLLEGALAKAEANLKWELTSGT